MESVKAGIIRDGAGAVHGGACGRGAGRDAKALEKVISASIRMKAGW